MKFPNFASATLALILAEAPPSLAANNDSATTLPSSSLLEAMSDYCKKASPPAPKFIEHVDGFLNSCDSFLPQCVEPLFDGYRFVEFEIASEQDRRNLPKGIYRAEIADSSSELCGPYIAATLRQVTTDPDGLARKKKCVALSKVAMPNSKYKMSIEFPGRPSGAKFVLSTGKRVVRIEDGVTMAEDRFVSARTAAGDATLHCESNRNIEEIYLIVIPPSVYAPFK